MKAIRLYANVLVDVAQSPAVGLNLSAVTEELSFFSEAIEKTPALARTLDNPTLGDDRKQAALRGIADKVKASPFTERFLSLLVRRNRAGLLPKILKEIETIQIEKKGGLLGELTTAVPLEAAAVTGVSAALEKKLKKPVYLKQKVDPTIIAGMRVTVAGITYDGTVQGQLEKLSGIN